MKCIPFYQWQIMNSYHNHKCLHVMATGRLTSHDYIIENHRNHSTYFSSDILLVIIIVFSLLFLWILLHFASRRCTVAAMTGQLFIGLQQKDAMSCARDSSKRTQIPRKCLCLNMSNIRVCIYKLDSSMYTSHH